MGLVPRREVEVVAPLALELSGAGQSRAESTRGVLLCCYFLLLLRMFTVTVPAPTLQAREQVVPSSSCRSSRHRRPRRR
jgi:hypothetical protein